MRFAISNIAWAAEDDAFMLPNLPKHGIEALEIAPTRIIPETPYHKLPEAIIFAKKLRECVGIDVCSMQSIWYQRTESIFGSQEEVDALVKYTKEAVLFAEAIGCPNLVFGSPKNRIVPEGREPMEAISFFQEVGAFAAEHGAAIALEAVPSSYGTNFLNYTSDLFEFVKAANCAGLKMNLDCGTMIVNGEEMRDAAKYVEYVNHVHISENKLACVQVRDEHRMLLKTLKRAGYDKCISIEMGNQGNLKKVIDVIDYVKGAIDSCWR